MTVRRTPAARWIILSLAVGCSCGGPEIRLLSVSPQVLCEGEKAVVHWDADGDLGMAMEVEPEASDPSCPATGRETFALTLVAREGGEEADRKVEVVHLHGPTAEPVAIQTNAIEGVEVVARGEKNVALWGDRVEVATVAACGHRSLEVQHSGKVASLRLDGGSSDALAGTALAGEWELSSPLSPEEQAQPSLRPNTLTLLATLRCRLEKP